MECCEVGVDVPSVKIAESLLAEPTEGVRSLRNALSTTFVVGKAGDMALRLFGEAITRVERPKLDVSSISGVRNRVGGKKGEKEAGAGLRRLRLDVGGRLRGVIERGSTSIKFPPI